MILTKNSSLSKISFFQALGLASYCSIVGFVLSSGEQWFNKIPEYFAPLLMLLILSTSALVCGLITLSYPIILVIKKKQPIKAVKLVFYTILWLIFFISLIIIGNLIFKF